MRFIYIDTKGKEVSIPTVDALALRIELGAITEATRLYDEAADRWAPAGEHEVFRSIVREQQERSGGFVAPPPPTPVVQPPPAAAPAPAPPARAPDPFEALDGPAAQPAEPPPAKPSAIDPLGGLGFDLTLEPVAPAPEPPPAEAEPEPRPGPTPEAAAPPAQPARQDFDFSGFGGMLADEDDDDDEEDAASPPPPPAPPADHGLAVEDAFAASYGSLPTDQHQPAVTPGGMDLEQPLAEQPFEEAAWSPKDRMKIETAEDEAAASESASERARILDEQAGRPERSARARPAAPPPPPAKKSSPVPTIVGGLAVLAIVGAGGWFGWSRLRDRPQQPEETVEAAVVDPPVAIPAISPELEPTMRELADSTLADWLLALRTTLPAERGVPVEPDREWLSGAYLADASRFASIEEYWRAVGAYVDDLEGRDVDLFAALYRTRLDSARVRLDSAGISPEDGQAMLERAQAGFLAARPERRPVYQQLRDVSESALGLHQFLLDNEDDIEYDPAAGGASRDPVLEAVPATPELGRTMWDRVESITSSLDALGALDLVTTERLLGVFAAKLQQIPLK